MNSSSSTVDNEKYVKLLQEFEILRLEPGNERYRSGARGVDYLNLVVAAISNPTNDYVQPGHPDRIVYLHNELTYVLEPATHLELCALKQFLESNSYLMTIVNDITGITVTISARTFDFVVLID